MASGEVRGQTCAVCGKPARVVRFEAIEKRIYGYCEEHAPEAYHELVEDMEDLKLALDQLDFLFDKKARITFAGRDFYCLVDEEMPHLYKLLEKYGGQFFEQRRTEDFERALELEEK